MTSILVIYATAAEAGIASHLFFFIDGEWGIYAPNVAAVFAGLHVLLLSVLAWGFQLRLVEAISFLAKLSTGYFGGLLGSIAVYRLFFHRLKSFPGPLGCKISGFWSMKNTIVSRNKFRWHIKVQNFHKEHGDFVRISELKHFT